MGPGVGALSGPYRVAGLVEAADLLGAQAANLRSQYWLYVVHDRAATHPRLVRVQDPFLTLLVRAKGGVIVDEASVFGAAEE